MLDRANFSLDFRIFNISSNTSFSSFPKDTTSTFPNFYHPQIHTPNFKSYTCNIYIITHVRDNFNPFLFDNTISSFYNIIITFVRLRERKRNTLPSLPQISEAEFEVMEVVWKYAPINTNEVTERLIKTTNWSPKTIQTLLKRLVTKKALTYEKQSRVFVYTPLVEKSDYLNQESNFFLKKYYNGDFSAFVSAYLENERLSESEIDTLRSLLSQKGKNRGGLN